MTSRSRPKVWERGILKCKVIVIFIFFKKVLIIYGNLSSRVTGYCCRMRNQKMVVVTIKAKARKPKLTKEKKESLKKTVQTLFIPKFRSGFYPGQKVSEKRIPVP